MTAKIIGRIVASAVLVFLPAILSVALPAEEKPAPARQESLEDLLKTRISTAAKYEQTLTDAAASITIVGREEIERFGYRTLEDVLINATGFYTSYDRNYSYIGVRGFGRPTDYNNRILLLVNGNVLNEAIWGSAFADNCLGIDLSDVERIEIVRGPGSSLYGTWAMLAVINVITRTGAESRGLRLSASTGSYGRIEGHGAYGRQSASAKSDVFVSGRWADIRGQDLYFKEYDHPETGNGVARSLDWDRFHSFFASARVANLSFQGYTSSRTKGIPTGSWGTDFDSPDSRTRDSQRFAELAFNRDLGSKLNMSLRGYYREYSYQEVYPYGGVSFSDDAQERSLGTEFKFRFDFSSKNRLILGLESRGHLKAFYRYGEPGRDYFKGDFPFAVYSVYAQDEFSLSRELIITLGLRYDRYTNVGSSAVPRLALVYHPFPDTALKVLYGSAFRAPNVYEANYRDSAATGYIDQKVNAGLGSEKIQTAEFILEQRLSPDVYGKVSVFSFRMRDLIDLAVDPSDGFYQYDNINRAGAVGIELELTARFPNGWHGYASYSYQDARDLDLDSKLSNCPDHLLKAGLSFPLFTSHTLGVQAFYDSGRLTLRGERTKAFLLANVNFLSARLWDRIRLSARILNLFDARYAYPAGYEHLQGAIVQNGRNFLISLETQF